MADYILVRPGIHETQNHEILDQYTLCVYQNFGECFILYDEVLSWHNNGRPGNAFVGLLTRGRSKGKTTLMCSQRPVWISRFCLSETNTFFVYRVTDMRDKKTISEIIPDFFLYENPPRFYFYLYEVGIDEEPRLCKPVPHQKLDKKKIFKKEWL